jgi:hypothetical protein
MQIRDKLFIGGRWVAPHGRETIDVHNAGNGQVMGRVPAGDAADADAAVKAARSAFESWSHSSPASRAEFLEKISAGLKARADELARTIAQEVGMPLKMSSRIQAGLPIANFANYCEDPQDYVRRKGRQLAGVREPAGVAVAITPWNYPLHQITLKVAPALGRGCTRRPQALGGGALQRLHPRRGHRGGRLAQGRVQPRHRLRPGGGRGAGEARRRRCRLLHRFDARAESASPNWLLNQ